MAKHTLAKMLRHQPDVKRKDIAFFLRRQEQIDHVIEALQEEVKATHRSLSLQEQQCLDELASSRFIRQNHHV
jgi:hypothetical protein